MCDVQKQKKYTERPSPPFPANECCGEEKMGNDGRMYKSERNGRGICAWKLVFSPKRASPKKKALTKKFSELTLKDKTVPELRHIARDKGLKGYSTMKKAELLNLLA
jgi:hypothetical protein